MEPETNNVGMFEASEDAQFVTLQQKSENSEIAALNPEKPRHNRQDRRKEHDTLYLRIDRVLEGFDRDQLFGTRLLGCIADR